MCRTNKDFERMWRTYRNRVYAFDLIKAQIQQAPSPAAIEGSINTLVWHYKNDVFIRRVDHKLDDLE